MAMFNRTIIFPNLPTWPLDRWVSTTRAPGDFMRTGQPLGTLNGRRSLWGSSPKSAYHPVIKRTM